jgi:hypothetical protein
VDPDPGGPKTCGSGSGTLIIIMAHQKTKKGEKLFEELNAPFVVFLRELS